MKANITNTSKADQGVWAEGGLITIAPGATREITIRADYVERAQSLPFLKVSPVAAAASEDISKMKVAELKAYAKANDIDLGDAVSKADILSAIELALEANA